MAQTLTITPAARWRITGDSGVAQGADGTAKLASLAFTDMLRAEWEPDGNDPVLPVHDYDRARPSGQAFKAVYGYNADARSQYACCGAECYTYHLPASLTQNAYEATEDTEVVEGKTYYSRSGEGTDIDPYVYSEVVSPVDADVGAYYEYKPATVFIAALGVVVDRYASEGVQLAAILTDSITPPSVSMAIGVAAAQTPALATNAQMDADGNAVVPNKRTGMAGPVGYSFGAGAAARPFLHVFLFMADYLSVRKAWIEGGAIFQTGELSVSLSRVATYEAADMVSGVVALDIGRPDDMAGLTMATITGNDGVIKKLPRLAVWENITLAAKAGVLDEETDPIVLFRNMLSFFCDAAALYNGVAAADMVGSAARELAGEGEWGFTYGGDPVAPPTLQFATVVAHGLTDGAIFRGLEFASAIDFGMAVRLVAYGIGGTHVFPSATLSATPLVWWGEVMRKTYRDGGRTSALFLSDPTTAATSLGDASVAQGATTEVAVTPLCSIEATAPIERLPFDKPWQSGEISTVVLSVIPSGVPTGQTSEAFDVELNRSFSLGLPNSGVTAVASAPLESLLTAETQFGPFTLLPELGFGVRKSGDTYTWLDMPNSKNFTLDTIVMLAPVAVTFNGKTYLSSSTTHTVPVSWKWEKRGALTIGSVTTDYGLLQGTVNSWVNVEFSDVANPADTITLGVQLFGTMTGHTPFQGVDYLTAWVAFEVANLKNAVYYNNPGTVKFPIGDSYNWANQTLGQSTVSVVDAGTVRATIGGVEYSGEIPTATSIIPVSVISKDSAAHPDGNDNTAYATANFTAPARTALVTLTSATGAVKSGLLTLAARAFPSDFGGDAGLSAKAIALGLPQSPSMAYGVTDGLSISTAGHVETKDVGLMRLYQ